MVEHLPSFSQNSLRRLGWCLCFYSCWVFSLSLDFTTIFCWIISELLRSPLESFVHRFCWQTKETMRYICININYDSKFSTIFPLWGNIVKHLVGENCRTALSISFLSGPTRYNRYCPMYVIIFLCMFVLKCKFHWNHSFSLLQLITILFLICFVLFFESVILHRSFECVMSLVMCCKQQFSTSSTLHSSHSRFWFRQQPTFCWYGKDLFTGIKLNTAVSLHCWKHATSYNCKMFFGDTRKCMMHYCFWIREISTTN